VLRTLKAYPNKTVYTYGPLIHNPVTMKLLEEKGVRILDPEKDLYSQLLPNSPVIIRAHGISPQKRLELEKCGAVIIDATCPRVIASQRRAAQYAQDGCMVILAGDRNHGELVGIMGHAEAVSEGSCRTVQNAHEAELLDCGGAPAVLLAQTTIKRSEYCGIANILLKQNPSLHVLETICPATDERQEALLELIDEVDALLIIGGKASANTRRLLQTALDAGKPAWLTETTDDIPDSIYNYRIIGLAAGASTPDSIISAVESAITGEHLVPD
ncbi:MAG: 4-hydroxy-3-methylbut-2-enyl diphosphate reductase, partial [Treponema sp.]